MSMGPVCKNIMQQTCTALSVVANQCISRYEMLLLLLTCHDFIHSLEHFQAAPLLRWMLPTTKPQIFMNISGKAEYIGGNKEFYNSKWNLGENNSKQIKIKNLSYNTPNLKNPMRF